MKMLRHNNFTQKLFKKRVKMSCYQHVTNVLKGPIPVSVFLFTIQIKCLCPLELIFIMKPQGLHVLLGEIWQRV